MRSFPFRHQARLLKIDVVPVDEGWELWVAEDDRRLAYGGKVTVDDAIAGWRVGDDHVQELAEEVKSNVLTGKLTVGPLPSADRGSGQPESAPAAGPA
jgi:hypothetical protein